MRASRPCSACSRAVNAPLAGTVELDGVDVATLPRRRFAQSRRSAAAASHRSRRPHGRRTRLPRPPPAPRACSSDGAPPNRRSSTTAMAQDRCRARSPTARWATSPADSASGCGSRWPSRRSPRILLLDEPTTFLDLSHQIEVLDLLRDLNRTDGTTIVVVLHELNLAARYADDLVVMSADASSRTAHPTDVLTSRGRRRRRSTSTPSSSPTPSPPPPSSSPSPAAPTPPRTRRDATERKTRMSRTTSRLRALAALTVAGGLVPRPVRRHAAGTDPPATPAPASTDAFPVTIRALYGDDRDRRAPRSASRPGAGAPPTPCSPSASSPSRSPRGLRRRRGPHHAVGRGRRSQTSAARRP